MRRPHLAFRQLFCLRRLSHLKGRVIRVEITAIGVILRASERIAEALIVNDLALAQELQRIAHVGIVNQTNQVVIGDTRLLLCCYPVSARKSEWQCFRIFRPFRNSSEFRWGRYECLLCA